MDQQRLFVVSASLLLSVALFPATFVAAGPLDGICDGRVIVAVEVTFSSDQGAAKVGPYEHDDDCTYQGVFTFIRENAGTYYYDFTGAAICEDISCQPDL